MAGRRLNKNERQYVKRSRKQQAAEQRIMVEAFNAQTIVDPQFGRIASKLSN